MNNFPFCIEFDFSSDSIHLLLFFSVFWWWFSGLWRWSSGVTWPISKWRTKLVHIGGSRGTSTEYENEESYPSTVGIWFTVMELLSLCTIRNTSIQIFKTTSIEPPPPPRRGSGENSIQQYYNFNRKLTSFSAPDIDSEIRYTQTHTMWCQRLRNIPGEQRGSMLISSR